MFVQSPVQTLAESEGNFEHSFVAIQLDYVARALHDCGAMLAPSNVFLHGDAETGFNFAVEIV
jgi:hypothetical protein